MPLSPDEIRTLKAKAQQLRCDMIDVTVWSGGAHIGGSLSMADVLTVLYYHYLQVKPGEPGWPERDRFVLSKGHGGVGLAAVLADKGYFDKELLREFNHFKSPLRHAPGRQQGPGRGRQHRLARPRPVHGRRHGARRQVPGSDLAHLLPAGRRRVQRGLGVGGRDGGAPLQARHASRPSSTATA